jgi:hypothetical protein
MTAALLGISHKWAVYLIVDYFPFRFWRSLDSFLCAKMHERFNLPTQNNAGTSPGEIPENSEISQRWNRLASKVYQLTH